MVRADLPSNATTLTVDVFFSPASRQLCRWTLVLPAGSSVALALAAGKAFSDFPDVLESKLRIGVWGRRVGLNHLLASNDRIEIYRPLRVDPKVARRQRFDRQGAGVAGLFVAKRPGAKAGY